MALVARSRQVVAFEASFVATQADGRRVSGAVERAVSGRVDVVLEPTSRLIVQVTARRGPRPDAPTEPAVVLEHCTAPIPP